MDDPAQPSGEPSGYALGIIALALGVEDRVGHPPEAVGDEAEREQPQHQPSGLARDMLERSAGILGAPQLQRQIADDEIEQAAGGEADPGQQQEARGYARHRALT